jgi:hypothetical protein
MNMIIYVMIAVVAVVGVAAYLWLHGKKELVKSIALALVLEVEKWLGDGRGQAQFDTVYTALQPHIPAKWRWYFTEARVKTIIEWAVREMKKKLGDGTGAVNPGVVRLMQAGAVAAFADKAKTDWVMNLADAETKNLTDGGIEKLQEQLHNEIFAGVSVDSNLQSYTNLQGKLGLNVKF